MKITDEMVMRGQLATNGLKYGLTDAEMRAALEAAVADVPVPKAVKVDAERATEKLKLWFFRDLLDEHRTMLFGLFGMPVSEIRNHGDQNHAFRHVVAALAAPAPEAVKDDESLWNFWNDKAQEQAKIIVDLRSQVSTLRNAIKPFADFHHKAEGFVQARVEQGGSPIMSTKQFRLADFAAAVAALNAEGK